MQSTGSREKAKAKVTEASNSIMEQFQSGNLPKALGQVVVAIDSKFPCHTKWSWGNRLLMALAGTDTAMGYNQWETVGRRVRKGTHGFGIFGPIIVDKKDKDGNKTGDKALVGYKLIFVHPIENTDVVDEVKWNKAAETINKAQERINNLPLLDVAKAWGITVKTANTGRANGWYSPSGKTIALGVENLSTWAHELVHAADHKLGNLTEKGQHWRRESVAEFGGAVLLYALGYETEADLGGAFKYIEYYAKELNKPVTDACLKVLSRMQKAVELIMETAEELSSPTEDAPVVEEFAAVVA